jgi:hypothetical protein
MAGEADKVVGEQIGTLESEFHERHLREGAAEYETGSFILPRKAVFFWR